MKWNDIQSMDAAATEKALRESKAQLVDARFRASAGALKQVHQIKVLRKTIARLLTRSAQKAATTHESSEESIN